MIDVMQSGSVIYDLAASQGGNSELTKVDEVIDKNGVKNDLVGVTVKNRDGTDGACPKRPLLADKRVRFVGEPIVLVVADSITNAKDAAELIEIDYNDLPVPDENKETEETNENKIKDLVSKNGNENREMNNAEDVNLSIEQSILKKIKN